MDLDDEQIREQIKKHYPLGCLFFKGKNRIGDMREHETEIWIAGCGGTPKELVFFDKSGTAVWRKPWSSIPADRTISTAASPESREPSGEKITFKIEETITIHFEGGQLETYERSGSFRDWMEELRIQRMKGPFPES